MKNRINKFQDDLFHRKAGYIVNHSEGNDLKATSYRTTLLQSKYICMDGYIYCNNSQYKNKGLPFGNTLTSPGH